MEEKKYLNLETLTLYDGLIKEFVDEKLFMGTYEEYETANANGEIPVNALVVITDDETSGGTGGGSSGSSFDFIDVEELPSLTSETAVPNSGYVEKVYFNTNLSDSEVETLLSQLTYQEDWEYAYGLICISGSINPIIAMSSDGLMCILNSDTQQYYWANQAFVTAVGNTVGLTTAGWQTFDNPVAINSEVVAESDGLAIGTQNDLIKDLFYTSSPNPDLDLSKIYRVPNYSLGGGAVVPNTGTVGKVYFNTNLSNEQVVTLLDKLTYIETDTTNHVFMAPLLSSIATNRIYVAQKHYENTFLLDIVSYTLLWSSENGWEEFTNPIEINSEVESEVEGIPIGVDNELIKELFYTEPLVDGELLGYQYYRVIDGEWAVVLGEADLSEVYKELESKVTIDDVNEAIQAYMTANYGDGDTEEF